MKGSFSLSVLIRIQTHHEILHGNFSRSKIFFQALSPLFISLLLLYPVGSTWAGQRTNSSVWLEKQ